MLGNQLYLSRSTYRGGVGDNPLNDYGTPFFLADFGRSQFRNNGGVVPSFTSLSGLTFTRASTGYAQTAAGVLVPFASGAPRITDKGLLIEGARTNLCLQSQTFDNASWNKTTATVTADVAVAPDGTLTADLLTSTSAGGRITQSIVAGATVQHAYGIFAKQGSVNTFQQILRNSTTATNVASCVFTLSGAGSASASAGTATITALANGWYYCAIVPNAATITSGDTLVCYAYAGPGSSTGDSTYIWGAQLEAAAFPSSYIPTTTASVTRSADVATVAISGLAYPVTLFAEFEPNVISGAEQGILCADKSGGATDVAYMYKATSGAGTGFIYASGATQMTAAGAAFSAGSSYKLAMRVAANDGRYCQGGTLATLDSTVTLPNAPDRIILGQRYNLGGFQAFGYIRRAAIWPTAFSDANLQSVTN